MPDGPEGDFYILALGGHRHEIFRVGYFQWESMGSENGTMEKKNPKLLTPAIDSR